MCDKKEELITKLESLQGRVTHHFVNADRVEYTDKQATPLLIVKKETADTEHIVWSYLFTETQEKFSVKESIER